MKVYVISFGGDVTNYNGLQQRYAIKISEITCDLRMTIDIG